nr:hypothetical protein [Paraburkholderia rhynchosiae]
MQPLTDRRFDKEQVVIQMCDDSNGGSNSAIGGSSLSGRREDEERNHGKKEKAKLAQSPMVKTVIEAHALVPAVLIP